MGEDGTTTEDQQPEERQSKTKEERETEAVTDFHHEEEVDIGKAQAALNAVTSSSAAAPAKVLFTGTLAQEDVALVMDECDLTKEQATQLLQENEGKVGLSLKAFISEQ